MAFENVQRGVYQVGDKEIYFRSKWEANYALYLQWLKEQGEIKDWEYEPQPYFEFPIKHGSTRYLPDFRVTNNDDTWYLVEVKGYKQGMVKIRRMYRYHPTVKIEIVHSKDYAILKAKVGKMLNFY